MMNDEFVGARLELARSFQQVTLKTLADTVCASISALGNYERGLRRQPPEDLTAALALALKVKPQFFRTPLEDLWIEKECSFRHRVATSEGVKKMTKLMIVKTMTTAQSHFECLRIVPNID